MTFHQPGEERKLIKMITSNSSCHAAIVIRQKLVDLNGQRFSYKILNQNFNIAIRGLVFPRYHFLFDSFNTKVKQLYESGLIQRWILMWRPSRDEHPVRGPAVLTISDLSMGFKVWFCVLLIAKFGFLLELAMYQRAKFLELFLSIYRWFIFKSIANVLPKGS